MMTKNQGLKKNQRFDNNELWKRQWGREKIMYSLGSGLHTSPRAGIKTDLAVCLAELEQKTF